MTSKQNTSEPTAYGLRSTWVLALGTFAVGTDAFIVSAFLPQMATDLSITSSAAAYSVTAFALVYALLAPFIATLTSTWERRKLLISSLVLLGLSNIASSLSLDIFTLITTRITAAIAAAAYTPNAGAVAASIVRPELRARALSVVIGGLTAATALGIPLGHVVSAVMNWRASLVLVGALSLAAALGVFFLMPSLPGGSKTTLRERLAVINRPGVVLILPLTVLGMAACYAPYAFTIELLSALQIPPKSVTFMLFVYGMGAVLGNTLSGLGTDRIGPVKVLMAANCLMTLTLALLTWLGRTPTVVNSTYVVAFLMASWGMSTWAQSPAQQHRLITAAPQEASLLVALNASCIYFGISLGTALGSYLIQRSTLAPFKYGFFMAAASLVYLAITQKKSNTGK